VSFDHQDQDRRPDQPAAADRDRDPLDELLAHLAAYPDERVSEWARRLARGDDRATPAPHEAGAAQNLDRR
jgi:hypothetical protein